MRALEQLLQGSTDLVIVDWEDDSAEFLGRIRESRGWRKPTVVAILPKDGPVAGADVSLRKPVTTESGAESLKLAYSRLLYDHRRHARYAVMSAVKAIDSHGQSVDITITDIGDGGIGLFVRKEFSIGDALSFYLQLPGANRAIYIQARVQWTRRYGAMGCEFLCIPPADLNVLHDWLTSKTRIKKPMVAI